MTVLPSNRVFRIGDTFSRRAILLTRDHWSVSITFLWMNVGRTDMKFDSRSGNRRSRSQYSQAAPAMVESLETRALLAAPQIVSPTGTITDSTPVVTWEAVDTATTYDLWISDLESRERLVLKEGLTTTSYTVADTEALTLGRVRIWARANFANGSTTGWGTPTDVLLQVSPTVTGPVNAAKPATPTKIDTSNPTVTWSSPDGARSFEIFLSNQTERTSKTYSVTNLTPRLDAQGNTIPDGKGDVLRDEIRSFEIPDDLLMGQYRLFMRTTDDAGRVTGWTAGYNFEVAPEVTITRPSGPTFQDSHIVTVVVTGTPTSGTYRMAFSVWNSATSASTYRTAALPFNATSTEVQAAVRALPGFGAATVSTTGASPNLVHKINLSDVTKPVTIETTEAVTPGTVNAAVAQASGILLEWEAVPGATHYEVFVARRGATEGTPIYNPKYLTTTSYRVPALLATGDYVFWVRARRLHQVTEVAIKGTPTSGTYRLSLTTYSTAANGTVTPTTVQTAPLTYNASATELQAAIRAVSGFETVVVSTSGVAPNVTHLVQIPQRRSQVKVAVTESVVPGTVTATTTNLPEVVGLWSARSDFSSIQAPVISAPVGVGNDPAVRLVTDLRPTLEWTKIDGTARYEVWVDRTASPTTYLKTNSGTNSYTFTSDIPAGNYWVWVRAVSTSGATTPWSAPYKFTATGGTPVITSPVNNQSVLALPTITWVPVTNAVSYNIQIAWINNDFTYIERTGITTPYYTVENPLNAGSYRVWVRAVLADGTVLDWSAPATFIVTDNELPTGDDADDQLLASLVVPQLTKRPEQKADQRTEEQPAPIPMADHPVAVIAETSAIRPIEQIPADSAPINPEAALLIEHLAEACVDTEWWSAVDKA